MGAGPLRHAFDFWKPLLGEDELATVAGYGVPGEHRPGSVTVWRSEEEPRQYRVLQDGARFSLFAAVHPIDKVPDSAEAVAEIRDVSGAHRSFVLWFPGERGVVLPFDPDAAVEAMWFETHVPEGRRTVLPARVLSAYYALKPLVPASLRRGLRRLIARRAEEPDPFLSWPSDHSLDLLMRFTLRLVLMAMGRDTLPFVWFWPDGHPWAAILTHDVETASGLANVPRVMGVEVERSLVSSFNLVPRDYEVEGSFLKRLRDAGFEVGVHGYTHDGLMFSSWSTFTERVVAINEYGRRWGAAGFRSPATYRNLEWFHLLAFEYDSSVADTAPFEPQPGGCASCFPYEVGGLLELPLTLPQDHTLFSLLKQTDARVWLAVIAEIRGAHGMACMLAHPDPGEGYIGRAENEALYVEVLDLIAGSDAWTPLPRELARWWRARSAKPSSEFGTIEGAALGTAVLDPSGRIEIVPPVR